MGRDQRVTNGIDMDPRVRFVNPPLHPINTLKSRDVYRNITSNPKTAECSIKKTKKKEHTEVS